MSELIGRGGTADVFLGTDLTDDSQIAIKVLKPEYAGEETFRKRFEREAADATRVSGNPHIVHVYAHGIQDERAWIVMEYVDGESLREILKKHGTPSIDRSAEIVCDVADALQFIHDFGIVHRDIKPGNVMITTDGTVKIADFGIARSTADSDHLTRVGSVVGTAAYLSPEQARGKEVDARSDIYGMGCLLYELLTRRPPFVSDSSIKMARDQVKKTPLPPSRKHSNIPHAMDLIVLKAISKDPNRRYQTAGEMKLDLRRFRAGERLQAEDDPPDSLPPPQTTTSDRHHRFRFWHKKD